MVYRKRVTTTGPKNNKSQNLRSFPLDKGACKKKKKKNQKSVRFSSENSS